MSSKISPQQGPQTLFLTTEADIAIYGGAAGGGKSFALLLTPLPYVGIKGFGTVIFRRDYGMIFSEGSLWDESMRLYTALGNVTVKRGQAEMRFTDRKGDTISKISYRHIARDDELSNWQGSQICQICFDELTHFSQKQFFYMLSRNRSTCGVRPFVRATCNPDADSWVAKFISWWINDETGYAIQERSGVLRWFIRRGEEIHWADSKTDLIEQFGLKTREEQAEPKSVTFIASTIYDNKIMLSKNPEYLANLKALPIVERERLLSGNWKIKPAAGLFFKRTQIGDMLPIIPADVKTWVRSWDLAATSEDEGGEPAYTAGVLMGKRSNGRYIVADVINRRLSSSDVRATIKHTAATDNARLGRVAVRLPKDPGQAGKDQAESMLKFLAGYNVKAIAESGSKEARAEPVAAQWQSGNFDIVVGDWNEMYFTQLESFPSSKFKDMVDATSTAFAELENVFDITSLIT
ncbi:terminase [Clostridia bacterium]|nr:terminase [Clostridia bacterium]